MPDVHALLAPSAAKRWMTCTPSARLEADMPESTSVYAKEGTFAHAIAENLLQYYKKMDCIAVYDEPTAELVQFRAVRPELIDIENACINEGFDFHEMLETVHNNYVRQVWDVYVRAKAEDRTASLYIEQMVDLSDYVPESFGSSDAIVQWRDKLQVFDLKYGKGVRVSAKGNLQMRLYALGALVGPCEAAPVRDVTMTIIQPRLRLTSSDNITARGLIDWAQNTLSIIAEQAWKGAGDFVPGQHCEFCRVKATCKALAEYTARIVNTASSAGTMTVEELAAVLPKLATIETWIAGVKSKAMELLEQGQTVPGWKLVEGRSVRKIADEAKARAVLSTAGFSVSDYTKTELRGITDLTKLVGGAKIFNSLLGDLVERTTGKPTLAPEDDPRAPYKSAAAAEAAFKNCV